MKALKEKSSFFTLLQIIAAIAFSFSSIIEPSTISVCLVLLVSFSWTLVIKKTRAPYFDFYIFGMVFNAISFFWLAETISYFGGFGDLLADLIFLVYCLSHSLQFVLFVFLYQQLKKTKLEYLSLAFPLSWVFCEFFFPRMFPWSLVNPMISWQHFSGLAEFVGVFPLSGLLLYWFDLILSFETKSKKKMAYQLFLLFSSFSLLYLAPSMSVLSANSKRKAIAVSVVQGNITAKELVDPVNISTNLSIYQDLSKASAKSDLLIWPESAANFWFPSEVKNIKNTKLDPFPEKVSPMIFGAMSYQVNDPTQSEYNKDNYLKFNTAFAVDELGNVLGKYHKEILMPFGEYLPFAKIFPLIKKLSPETGDFSSGSNQQPIEINIPELGKIKVGVLICYEDLVSSLSWKMKKEGANLLVNLTNDAWYGTSYAARQHNLLAAWRAIETRTYLIRATNTGYTTIIDYNGQVVADLEAFKSGILNHPVEIAFP